MQSFFRHRLVSTWVQYWTAEGNGWHLSIFRMLWCVFHLEFALHILRWTLHEAYLPALPYHGLLGIFAQQPWEFTALLAGVHLCLTLVLLIGWQTRIVQVLIAISATILFFRTLSTYHNHHAFYLCVTWYMTLIASEKFFSVDARKQFSLLSKSDFTAWQRQSVTLLGQRLILLQLSLLYLFAALNKIDPVWFARWSSTPELLHLTESSLLGVAWQFLLSAHFAWLPLVFIILLLFFLSFGIFIAHRHPWIALLGIGMHLLFELTLPVIIFTEMCGVIWMLQMLYKYYDYSECR